MKEFSEEKRQHLEFIQNIITRMNTNCAQIKGAMITIVSALIAIYASTTNVMFIFLGIFPTLLFWFLDSYFLQQERIFRGIYDDVAGLEHRVEVRLYEMPIRKYTKKIDKKFWYWKVFVSKTIMFTYLPIIVLLSLIALLIYNGCITLK
jgi:hypothetical protein